ncbi:tryptophan synthase alpha chain [Kineococcus xinjiangensis]|uniref:Tryptophan synthase alpha chain n=1 Tax=Kineococcus xinjiangensis TaxID=512762 RepID=A0A2S6IUZ8_9ACTN|nr:tryptophan synthase subunit alpha [Kineococcus xinjiangensis]PPK98100.1 tryptophan synthase alpha chain [Kineococcus xinjiangensis]
MSAATVTGGALHRHLGSRAAAGRSLLVPYVMAGLPGWAELVGEFAAAGADAVEIGLPFSDPILDGPVICEAAERALAGGTTAATVLAELPGLAAQVPLVVMTYSNIVLHRGAPAFCAALRAAGVSGLIVPDVPFAEAAELGGACGAEGIDHVLLAAPSTPPGRLGEVAQRSRGFVYASAVMGTTGVREHLPATAARLAADLKALTGTPVLLGLGISSPASARAAAAVADGVVVGSALVRDVLEGRGPAEVGRRLAALRTALDEA